MSKDAANSIGKRPCPRCGQTFDCGAQREKCWCARVPTTPEINREIQRLYPEENCLCPACLDETIASLKEQV